MTASLLIGLIALTDLVRLVPSRMLRCATLVIAWSIFFAYATVGIAVSPIAAIILVAIALGWVVTMPASDAEAPRHLWPVFLLALLVVVAANVGPALSPALATADYGGLAGPLRAVPLTTIVAGVAILLFLTRSSNIITRSALRRGFAAPEAIDGTPGPEWELRIGGRVIGDIRAAPQSAPGVAALQGGRLIGPIERILIVILALAGAYVLIAALVAAKGVVRFPEISADRRAGSKAEEFLVGSLTSWTIATVSVVYLASVIYL